MSDPVTRLNTALEGRYRIESELGEGGMATVYLADDIKHERKVALKVLKPELAAMVGAERFLAEIKTTANLTHPHILPLHDSGEAGGFLFYVMPFIEGETLGEKIEREKQLGVEDALALTRKIADALDYAHENGVVHRDIKPANILLSQRGEPLVADFGIALAVAQTGAGRITETGLSLGTPYYMSPEQMSGDRDVDPRSDVYALACVLYEMLAGDPPFSASTAQAVLVKILTSDAPSITDVRRTVPPHVDSALARALEKLPADRFASAAEFAAALSDESFTYQARPQTPVASPTPEPVAASAAASPARPWYRDLRSLVAALAIGLAAWGWLRPTAQPAPTTRTQISLGDLELTPLDEIVVSPDGSRFAVIASVDGQRSLYWRDAAEENFRVIPGTEAAREGASFSPAGDWIVFATSSPDALMKVSLSGGAPTPVVPSGDVMPRLPHWGDAGMIVFTGPSGMFLVPETGGEPVLLLESGWISPSLLPGGRAVIGNRLGGGIMLLDLETDSVRELIPGGIDAKFVETGHLLYVDGAGGLWAVQFDPARGEVLGRAVPVLEGLSAALIARYSVSRNGTLVYGAGGLGGAGLFEDRLLVLDLEGNEEPTPLEPRRFAGPRWAPDGESVAYSASEPGEEAGSANIYTYNVVRRTIPRPLTVEGSNVNPVWSPDGTRVAFASVRDGTEGFDLFVKTVTDDSPPEMIVSLPGPQFPAQWLSNDLVIFTSGQGPARDLWMVDLSSDSAVLSPYLETEARLGAIRVSPDGDLAAYMSDESGTNEVYISSFPVARQPEIVSQGGGAAPLWSPDGNTIYYWTLGPLSGRRSLIAARIERGPPFVVVSRDTVLAGRYRAGGSLHPDGDKLVISQPFAPPDAGDDADVAPERFLVVVNWFTELRERMGGN